MRIAWISAGIYACVLIALTVYRWHIFGYGSDTGIFAQAILNTAHGFADAPEGGSHFRYHFSPILATLYPVLFVFHSALTIQIVQVILIALTGPAVYLLFRSYLDQQLRCRLAILTTIFAPLASIGFEEFHELAFLPVLLILLIWAADRERWGWFAILGAACIMVREDVGLEFFIIGIAIALAVWLRRKRSGGGLLLGEPRNVNATVLAFIALSAVSALTVLGYFHFVATYFGKWVPSKNYSYHLSDGTDVSGLHAIFGALVAKPGLMIATLAKPGKLTYLLEGLLPLALLPVRSAWTLLAAPAFIILFFSNNADLWNMGRHYSAMWAPWFIVGSGMALASLRRAQRARLALIWSNAAIAGCAIVLLAFNPMHLAPNLRPAYADVLSVRSALDCVPRGASIATHEQWFPHIATTNTSSTFDKAAGVDYLVFAADYKDFTSGWVAPQVANSVSAGLYAPVCRFGNVIAYRRSLHSAR